MKAFNWFFKVWLFACFALTFFIVPMYLIAVYPEVPEPYYRFARSIGYGVVRSEASVMGFWYRLASCGFVVSFGTLMVWIWLRDVAPTNKHRKNVRDVV